MSAPITILEIVDGKIAPVGDYGICLCGQWYISGRTPDELAYQLRTKGLPFPKWRTASGLRAKVRALFFHETVQVMPGDLLFPEAIAHRNDHVCWIAGLTAEPIKLGRFD